MDRWKWLLLIIVLASAYFLISSYISEPQVYATVTPSTVEPGDSITITVNNIDFSVGEDYIYDSMRDTDTQTGWCNTTNFYGDYYCMKPISISELTRNRCYDSIYGSLVVKAIYNNGVAFDPTYHDWAFDEVRNFFGKTAALIYGIGDRTNLYPFNYEGIDYRGPVYVMVRFENPWKDNPTAYAFGAFCVQPGVYADFSANGWNSYGTYTITGPDGKQYECHYFAWNVNITSSNYIYMRLYQPAEFYIMAGNTCYIDGEPCDDSKGYDMKLKLASIKVYYFNFELDVFAPQTTEYLQTFYCWGTGSDWGCSPINLTFHIDQDADTGTFEPHIEIMPNGYCAAYDALYDVTSLQTVNYVNSYTIVDYADSISIYDTLQSNDEVRLGFGVSVTGGTEFDSVKTYVEGCSSSELTIPKSSFICYTDHCEYASYLPDLCIPTGEVSSSSVSKTLVAELYAKDELRDTDSKSVTIYLPHVSSFTVNDTTSHTVQFTATVCSPYDHYAVYLDSIMNEVAQGTLTNQPNPGQCTTITKSITIDSLTSGTHTLYFRLFTKSGDWYDTVSDTFTANIVYTGSLTVVSPSDGATINVSASSPGIPAGTLSTSVYYSTDAPSATLELYVNGHMVSSWTVSGSGTKSYTIPASSLTCGTDTIQWKLKVGTQLLDTESVTVTVRCWYLSVGPSGTVQIPSQDGIPLSSSYVDVYIDYDVTPSTSTQVKLFWASDDVSSLLTPCIAHDYCAHITQSDVGGFMCDSSITLKAQLLEGSQLRAEKTSTIVLNCVEQYVIIRSPSDNTAYDVYSQQLPADFNIDFAVDYAGGNMVKVLVNNTEVSYEQLQDCQHNLCFRLTGVFSPGDNIVTVELYSGQTKIADDSITLHIYTWAFMTDTQYGSTTALITTKEYGSHAARCELSFDGNSWSSMLYSDADSTWNYQVSKDYDGSSYTVRCFSPTGAQVYEYNGTLSWPSETGPVGGGGGGISITTPKKPVTGVPFWPTVATAGEYSWTVITDKDTFQRYFSSVSVSEDYVCVKTDNIVSASYCRGDVTAIPAAEGSLSELVTFLKQSGCETAAVSSMSGLRCVPNYGTGLYIFRSGSHNVEVLVAKQAPTLSLSLLLIVLVAGVLLWLYLTGKLSA